MENIFFVTGTDTGVGKTLVTSLLLTHFQDRGVKALAMKPFCTGFRSDVHQLQALQPGIVTDDEVNPFYFKQGLAPLVAAKQRGTAVRLDKVLQSIRRLKQKCDVLLVEGCGGLMSPLGPNYTAANLISAMPCRVVVVARNQLGTLNHTLLTMHTVQRWTKHTVSVVLNNLGKKDASSGSNARVLREWLRDVEVVELPYLGGDLDQPGAIARRRKNLKKVLARFHGSDILASFFRMESSGTSGRKKAVDSPKQCK